MCTDIAPDGIAFDSIASDWTFRQLVEQRSASIFINEKIHFVSKFFFDFSPVRAQFAN